MDKFNSLLKISTTSISNLSVIGAVIITLFSMEPWFLWPLYIVKALFIIFFIVFRLPFIRYRRPYLTSLVFCFLLWCYLYFFHATSAQSIPITFLIKFLPLYIVITFSDKEKILYIKYVTVLFSCILIFSLLLFILWHIGIPLPNSLLKHPVNPFYGVFSNYYGFVIISDYGFFTRFQSVFTEPGHLGMFASILLYINRYDFRKFHVWVMFIALVWSFSLAAYILFVVGLLLFLGLNERKKMKLIFFIAISGIVMWKVSVFIYDKYPNSMLSQLIFSRLEFDEKTGIIGNNRNEIHFLRYYENMQSHLNQEYVLGIGVNRYSDMFLGTANSSYKVFIMQYGLIGIVVLLLFFLSLLYNSPSKLGLGLFFLYVISFIQRPYALWEIESFLFISSMVLFKISVNNNVKVL